ncbi:hypothetical protein DFH01_07625 [Falsiroseomonas bella]|uniref:Transmembrane protein n=1 Tax=Falsiroseomonas bella TaxID=2184016 RepID=A0A317FMB1_9PROT|nr:hypothetical protein [Falsiroseomonas bella]PWS39099.1 hypothetical protein DFH01_07625 [Falsiroseomonas bella]
MGLSPREILLRIARTAAIVLAGAAVLLLVLHLLAGLPDGHLLIVIALSAPLAALFGWVVAEALRSGVLPHRSGVDDRLRNPLAFWIGAAIYAIGAAALAIMAIWALAQVLA